MKAGIRVLGALVVLLALFLTGCVGPDGQPGDVYIGFDWPTWSWSFVIYMDQTIPGLPDSFSRGTFYQTSPGTYTGQYRLQDASFYYFRNYSVTVARDPGEEGGVFFQEGDDGKDRYYELYCSDASGGAAVTVTEASWADRIEADPLETVVGETRPRAGVDYDYKVPK